ncbi:MAG: hypothetical protein QOG37_2676 [Mycobacterium sp.]|nr:hypothetical protein [Mycobacterium sp.]
MDASAKAGFVETDRSVHKQVRWTPGSSGIGAIPATHGKTRRGPFRSITREFFTPEKGRPPPGGEEAEVVVYQPRGVGLIHPRHKAE